MEVLGRLLLVGEGILVGGRKNSRGIEKEDVNVLQKIIQIPMYRIVGTT